MPKLVFKNAARMGETVDVDAEVTIGREGVDLTIDDAKASRRHAAIRPRDGGLEVEDLGSMNGTFVNGNRIDGAVSLSGGDVVQIGDTAFEVEAEGEQAGAGETVLQERSASPPAPEAPRAPVVAPPPPQQAPFGPAPSAGAHPVRRGGAASRLLAPTLFAFGTIAATAAALVVYFATR